MTLTELDTETRYHLNDDNSDRYTSAIVTKFINNAYRHYYNKLVQAGYKGLLSAPAELDLVATTQTVALPSDFYKCFKLSKVQTSYRTPLQYRSNLETSVYTGGVAVGDGYKPDYDFQGTDILLQPAPSASETGALYLEYWATMTELSSGTDTVTGGFSPEWQPMIPLRAAVFLKGGREEEEVRNLTAMLDDYESEFKSFINSMTKARKKTDRFNLGA